MKKVHSLIATLFAATALYAGDILEICPWDPINKTTLPSTWTHDGPAPSGERLYFNVRLIGAYQNNTPPVAKADRSHFDLDYIAVSGMGKEADLALNPLKIGIVVSGKTKWARLVDVTRTSSGVAGVDEACNLTDCVFEYLTEPGDFALPIRLAQDDKGTPCGLDNSGKGPVFLNQNKWAISYTEQPAYAQPKRNADLSALCPASHYSGDTDKWFEGLTDAEQARINTYRDITLYNAGFWVQALDIDGRTDKSSWEDPAYWKSVAKGHTVSSTVRSNGDAVIGTNTVVWIWAVDKAWLDAVTAAGTELGATWVAPAVEMAGSNMKSIPLTVGYNRAATPATPKTETVNAARVEIVGGAIKGDFTFKGKDEGDVYLVMSGSSNFLWKAASGYEFVKDSFVTVPVKGIPAEREVTLRRTEAAETYTVTSDYETPITTLNLTLAEDYAGPVTVEVTPKLSNPGDPVRYEWPDYIRIAEEADGYERDEALTVTFKDGKAGTKTVYVFGRGAAGEDSGLYSDIKKGNRIEFGLKVSPEEAAGGRIIADSLYVKPADPVIANAGSLAAVSARGGVALPIDVNVSDNFTDMNDTATGYKVMFRAPGATEEEVVELKTKGGAAALWRPKGASGTLYAYDKGAYTGDRPAIPDNVSSGEAELWLVAPNEAKSARVAMTLTVTPPSQVKARSYDANGAQVSQFAEFDATTGEATPVYVEVEISEKYEKADSLYAFLKLADASKAAYVEGDCLVGSSDFSMGIPIPRGDLVSSDRGVLYLKDGVKQPGTALKFSIVLCTTSEYDDKTKVEGFTSNDITLKVTNVAPVVNDIRMNGWRLTADKTRFKGSATVGIEQTFKFDVWDAARDLSGEGADAMKITYTFTDGNTTDAEEEKTGDPATWEIKRKFRTVGTDTCSIEYTITDKDGGKTSGSAYIPVTANPFVSIEGEETSFYENTYPRFTLALSETPDADLTVRLTVTPQASGDKRGKLIISGGRPDGNGNYDFEFKAGATPRQTFGVSDADGTAGGASQFDFSARVTTTELKPGTTTAWSDFYEPGALAPITVLNVEPTLIVDGRRFDATTTDYNFNSSNSPILVAIGKDESTKFPWSVDDVADDLGQGISVTITDQAGSHKYKPTTTGDDYFTPEFKYAGKDVTTVTLTATDKDGGSITVTRYYRVNSTRQLSITAVGPSENGVGSAIANRYRLAGRGQGHVWVNATCTGAKAFSFDYNCGLANFVQATAQGYRKGDEDNGSLTERGSGGDIPITQGGALATGEPYFTYQGEYDSFFYCWVKVAYDNGTTSSEIYGGVSPEVQNAGMTQIQLPTEKDDEDAYALTTFEVIFSKEYLPSDNVGDINNDGIPDIYALGYAGFGVTPEDGSDTRNLRTFNDDGDYYPFIFDDIQSSFIFMTSNTWASNVRKFTAFDEIRGIDPHFNDAYQVLAAQGYAGSIPAYTAEKKYTDPANDPESTLSALEYDAWVQAGSPDPDTWSPERPTDPTTPDTDGDGMPDGYEYYIWYKAHVGWFDNNGKHQYLTGHKYNHLDPTSPTFITPAEIAGAFDPLANGGDWATRDMDNDGLTDYQEFLLGTCPWEWDTDNDLLPDGYEVVVTGTDPRVYDTNDPILKRHADGIAENPDGDAMAVFNLPVGMIGVLDGNEIKYFALDLGTFNPEVFTEEESGAATHVRTGTIFSDGTGTRTYVTTGALATYTKDEKTYLQGYLNANLWTIVNEGGRQVLGVPATLERGTEVTNIQPDAEYFYKEISSEEQIAFQPTSAQKIYTGWRYLVGNNPGSMDDDIIARGPATTAAALMGKPVIFLNNETTIRVMHDDVLAMRTEQAALRAEKTGYRGPARCGYNPTTAWQSGGTDSGEYVNHDEFMSMFYLYHRGVWGAADLTPSIANPFTRIWSRCATSPVSADTEGDQIPDGWELYVGAGKAAISHEDGSNADRDDDGDWLSLYQEYSGIDSSAYYGWAPWDPAWRNKKYPTCPKHIDTDEDGLTDAQEGGHVPSYDTKRIYLSDIVGTCFKYNGDDNRIAVRTRTCWAGGMLDPCSCDTDLDGLPDEWEAEFHGSYIANETGTINTNVGGTNTASIVVGHKAQWNMDGMDGTVCDARLDYDGDGLANWQEYMAGTMRCWRYDDAESPWESGYATVTNMPAAGTDEWNQFWYELLLDKDNVSGNYNPHMVNGTCDPGRYLTRCPYAWDHAYGKWYYFKDGADHALIGGQNPNVGRAVAEFGVGQAPYGAELFPSPKKYISCDPRLIDSDHDGMDDYYELFHGMNPLLGVANQADATGAYGKPRDYNTPCDLVFDAYVRGAGKFSTATGGTADTPACARNNFWTSTAYRRANIKNEQLGGYDFVAHPWMNGLAAADADGDGIVNVEEAIMANVQAASTYHHTDPTPLWTTDSSYTNSLTRRFYRLGLFLKDNEDGLEYTETWSKQTGTKTFEWAGVTYDLTDFDGFAYNGGTLQFTYNINTWDTTDGWAFSFEENEGYDSDHDYLSDMEELQGKTKNASDPQDHDDPLRRQAMYFNGTDAFLQTPVRVREVMPNELRFTPNQARQNFLYFTVECWAKPDEAILGEQATYTLVERAIYADNAGPADENLIRKNFQIGLKNGRWYASYDSTGTSSNRYEITNGPQATADWALVTATFDGEAFKLYVNGVCNNQIATRAQPEHGVNALAVTPYNIMTTNGYGTVWHDEDYVTILVGASVKTKAGFIFDNAWRCRSYALMTPENPYGVDTRYETTFADYHNYYRGYIDEVRIWDGARTAANIQEDYDNRTRYTLEKAAENQLAVYNKWVTGCSRAPTSPEPLPALLMYHWAFDHVPGAVNANDVIAVPAGFNTPPNVTDAAARWVRPADYKSPHWESVGVRSTVYDDAVWVPWINNTAMHLPRLDRTTLDSVYWSDDYVGYQPVASSALANFNVTSISFPRKAETPSVWHQTTYSSDYYDSHRDPYFDYWNGFTKDVDKMEGNSQNTRWHAIAGYEMAYTETDDTSRFTFTGMDRNVVGDDLLPMGGVYPRRISLAEGGFWDNRRGESPAASDAWAQTGNDADNNGLPDWWEEYARNNYCEDLPPWEPLTWDTTVTYRNGMPMPAYQAYLRDLASGLIKDGRKVRRDSNYADSRDTDKDGLPDWWEEMFGLDTAVDNADDDPDNDGLSNYQEYLIGEFYLRSNQEGGFAEQLKASGVDLTSVNLSPVLAFSTPGQVVPDYFLRYTDQFADIKTGNQSHFFANEYFGEIATDHDFIEDWWELLYDITYTNPKKYDPFADKDGDGWSTYAECRASLWGAYFTADLIDKWTGTESQQYVPCYPQPIIGIKATYYGKQDISGHQLVVRTTSGQRSRTDATFVIPSSLDGQTRYIGGFSADTIMHGHLSPGLINVNSVVFDRARVSGDKVYTWNCDWYQANVPDEVGWDNNYPWKGCSRTHTGSFERFKSEYQRWPRVELEGGDFSWESFVATTPSSDLDSATFFIDGATKFGTLNCVTGEYALDMSKFTGEGAVDEYIFRVTYTSRLGHEWPQAVYVSDTKELELNGTGGIGDGYVREGKNTIEAFIDLDDSGTYTAGEPYGVVQNVDVGWHKVPVTVIELKDTSHIVPRFDIANLVDDRTVVEGTSAAATETTGEASADAASGLTKTLKIRRTAINGITEVTDIDGIVRTVPNRTLVTKTLVLDSRSYLTEADIVGNAKFDLDSKWLVRDAIEKLGFKRSEIQNATYEISEVLTLANDTTSNVVLKTFVNTFNPQRVRPTAVSPVSGAPVYACSPTLAFACSDETMTAYRLQIRRKGAAKAIYDSGDGQQGYSLQPLPGRVPNAAGAAVYEVTPAVYAGARICSGMEQGAIFADSADYQWRVALFNAKFNEIEKEEDWSAWADFQMDVGNLNRYPRQATGYGNASASVRYYGPTNATAENVWVEAFENADFRGQPAARATLGTVELLADYQDTMKTNALMNGLAPGTYYFRAFIDFNGNGQRDDWESWGYANYVGKGVKAIYNPMPFTVTASTSDFVPNVNADFTIYIEDCDTDQNEIPDCMEASFYGGSGSGTGTTATDADGDGIPNSDEEAYGTDPALADTDNDGMPDGWEALFADTDPTLSDAFEVLTGDVMAFAKLNPVTFVTITNGDDKVTYMLAPDEKAPRAGDSAQGLEVYTTYTYPIWEGGKVVEYLGIGTNLTLASASKVQTVNANGTAILVHAQVYDLFGYDMTTATAADGAAHTKPFTALDKYLVVRYLQALGLADEAAANKAQKWNECTLKPYDTDFDKDGIADGWELYVMFGPQGAGKTGVTQSPWNYDDREYDADGDGLAAVDEYDGGYYPTDAWDGDSFGYGIGDKATYDYNIKGEDAYRIDDDNDQLANFIEYLISSMPDFPTLDAGAMATDKDLGQLVPDYFLRHGSLYLGEMFADHDMIEDWWEDEQPTELERGGVRLANYSRFVYDANKDPDSDGWNNWEECRATIGGGWTNLVTVVSNDTGVVTNVTRQSLYELAGSRPVPEVPAAFVYNGKRGSMSGKTIVLKAWCQENVFDPDMQGEADAAWVFTADDSHPLNLATNLAAATKGYLRSGKNMFVAYVAESAEAAAATATATTATEVPAYVPGQPYGVVTDVRVDYLKSAPFTIELTDVNAAIARIELAAAGAAQVETAYANFSADFQDDEDIKTVQDEIAAWYAAPTNKLNDRAKMYIATVSNCFYAAAAHYDRGANATTYTDLACPATIGTNMTFLASNVYVRVYRSQVNGQSSVHYAKRSGEAAIYTFASEDPVYEGTFNLSTHPFLTEADLLAAGLADLDWGTLRGAFDDAPVYGYDGADIESATYRVVLGTGTGSSWTNNNLLAALVVNRYELGNQPTPAQNLGVTAYGSQPTFFWTHENTIGKAYPAFQLKVTDGATVLYDSGVMPAPARDAFGRYAFTAPIWPGMMTASGRTVEADRDYTWKVTMLDAKFTAFPSGAASGTFRILGSGALSDYGQIAVAVKYMGPGTVATSGVKNLIRVEAYTSPDFSGAPYGVGYVRHTADADGDDSLAAADRIEMNALVAGLVKGKDYYLRAFLDTNGNGEREDWESWGYANFTGTASNDVYTARAVPVRGDAHVPTCVIYVEDADTNNNQLPDVWEWNKDGELGGKSTKGLSTASPYVVTIDATGAAAANILWTVGQAGAAQLPYYAMLTQFENGGQVPAVSLALAMAGIDLTNLDTAPSVRITSFSLTNGITFDVDTRATVDGDVLVPRAVKVKVTLTLQLQQATTLSGGWTDVGDPVTDTFTISETTTVSSDKINEAIRKAVEEKKGEGYFRVNVAVGSELAR